MEKSFDLDVPAVGRGAHFLITNDCATSQRVCCSVDSVLIFEGVFRNGANEQEQIGGSRSDMRCMNRDLDSRLFAHQKSSVGQIVFSCGISDASLPTCRTIGVRPSL